MTVCERLNSVETIERSPNLGAPSPLYPGAESITDILHNRALRQTDDVAFVYVTFDDQPDDIRTYGDLDRAAGRIAHELARVSAVTSTDEGQRFVLAFPPCVDFVDAYFGVLYCGAEAVNVFAPETAREQAKFRAIVADCRPSAVLTHSTTADAVRSILQTGGLHSVPVIATDALFRSNDNPYLLVEPEHRSGTCFIQYTSGSTSSPKGVIVRHSNLLHNLQVIDHHMLGSEDQRYLGMVWLPVFHDMGLVAGLNYPVFIGRPHVIFSHKAFVQRPQRWVEQLSRFGATHTGGPNFGFELCARFAKRVDKNNLDLSKLRFALCGAEPIRNTTLERFAAEYASCGLDSHVLAPAYGLAEATLMVTGTRVGDGVHMISADRAGLGRGVVTLLDDHASAASREGSATCRQLIASGKRNMFHDIHIVDPATQTPLADQRIGEIWVRSASVTAGYLGDPNSSEACLNATLHDGGAGYLRTGDLGFFDQDHLFITGRSKDVIILNGVNHHPQDLEGMIDSMNIDAIRRSVAFPVTDAAEREAVIILCELRAAQPEAEMALLALRVVDKLFKSEGIAVAALLLVEKGSIPRTSSGKLQRTHARHMYLENIFKVYYSYKSRHL
jgi:acyl-CoA synthetase (AMP-forming)/AMP-acid ligase II